MSDDSPQQKPVRTPLGVFDIQPDDQLYYTFIKKVVRHRCRQSGFRRITTPTFEYTDLYERAMGADSPIVADELYSFEDDKGRSLTLKPDATVGIARSYIKNNMHELAQPVELYYIEPQFRYRKPGRGYFRQSWHFGFEVLGENDPALDAQIILMGLKILEDLGISHLFKVKINNIGSQESRAAYIEELRNFYIGKERSLPESERHFVETNPIRLLHSEDEDAQILAQLAPKFENYRSKEDIAFHDQVKVYLDEIGVNYVEDKNLFRPHGYYSQTVFEFVVDPKNSDTSIGGGGRYDELVENLGGPETPAVGATFNMERIIHHMRREKLMVPSKDNLHLFVAQLGDDAKKKSLSLLWELRERGIKTVGALGKGSMKEQIRMAQDFKVPYMLILGITEVREGTIIIRGMEKGQQKHVPFEDVVDEVAKLIGEDQLDKYSPGEVVFE